MSRSVLVAALLTAGCTPAWEPPGGGVAKGCDDSWSYGRPLADGLGLSTHVGWGTSDDAVDQREAELAEWPGLGVRLARRDLYWSSVEPERGSFDFEGTDLLLDSVEGAGAELLGLLVYGNTWACSDCEDSKYPPDDPADYAAYAAALVERYEGRVDRWEIWNEPNAGLRFWKPEEDPEAYAALTLAAVRAIHAVDAQAEVALGGLFWPDLIFGTPGPEFLDAVLSAEPELVDELDAVAWHPYRYPFSAPEERNEFQDSLLDESCALREQLRAHGGERLDTWITELGWHTAPDALYEGVNEEDQAAFLVRSAVLSWASGSSVYLWYTFQDGGTSDSDQEARFGLYNHDGTPKQAAQAFSVLARAVGEDPGGSIEDRSVPLGLDESTYAYLLSGEETDLWILWTTEGSGEVTLPAWTEASVLTLEGEESTLDPEREAVTVTVDGDPAFVRIPQETQPGR